MSESSVPAPVVGAIPCGTPEEEEENIQEYVSLPVSLFGKGEFYILKACFRSCPVSLPTFRMCKKAAFLLIFFRAWNIIKNKLEATNQRLPP